MKIAIFAIIVFCLVASSLGDFQFPFDNVPGITEVGEAIPGEEDFSDLSRHRPGPGNRRCRNCPTVYNPVCGRNGITYSNRCRLRCSRPRTTLDCRGRCPCHFGGPGGPGPGGPGQNQGCYCPLNYNPVCGYDGQTYGNQCQAGCAHVGVRCQGPCPCHGGNPGGCFCPEIYQPVCGTDRITYGNACKARCSFATIRCHRQCPCGIVGGIAAGLESIFDGIGVTVETGVQKGQPLQAAPTAPQNQESDFLTS